MAYVAFDYGHSEDTWENTGGKGVTRNGKDYEEHHANADVGEQARKIVERHGVKVLVTQPPYGDHVSLSGRTYRANRAGVDAFVSFHQNAGTSSAQGACVFAWESSEGGNKLADLIVNNLVEQGIDLHGSGRHYSEVGKWTNFHVLRETAMPSVLIEHSFMTNARDFKNIFGENHEQFRRKCAIADAKAVLEYFGITYDGKEEEPTRKEQESINMAKTGFKDVPEDARYTDAVKWLKDQGIMKGYPDGTFGVGEDIKREEFAMALYRALK